MLSYVSVALRSILAPLRNERGADLAEYALLLALIAVVVIGAVTIMGSEVATLFNTIVAHLVAVM